VGEAARLISRAQVVSELNHEMLFSYGASEIRSEGGLANGFRVFCRRCRLN
jgi:hypothetical protein